MALEGLQFLNTTRQATGNMTATLRVAGSDVDFDATYVAYGDDETWRYIYGCTGSPARPDMQLFIMVKKSVEMGPVPVDVTLEANPDYRAAFYHRGLLRSGFAKRGEIKQLVMQPKHTQATSFHFDGEDNLARHFEVVEGTFTIAT